MNRWAQFTEDEINCLYKMVSQAAVIINDELNGNAPETYSQKERDICEDLLHDLFDEVVAWANIDEFKQQLNTEWERAVTKS